MYREVEEDRGERPTEATGKKSFKLNIPWFK